MKPTLRERYSVEQIGYFGSFAKGTQHEESDVDILVSFYRSVGWDFFSLKDFLESQFNRKVDLVTEGALRPEFKKTILTEVEFV
ncbi:MAG: nucleotidyltransferase family protein [Bacteroidota bacterium]